MIDALDSPGAGIHLPYMHPTGLDIDSLWMAFTGGLVVSAALAYGLRCVVLARLGEAQAGVPNVTKLEPVELGYLLRPGDASHCLCVLVVDLVQKGLKSPQDAELEVLMVPYEKDIWQAVKKYLKEWTEKKATELLPELKEKNPIRLAKGLWRLKGWLTESFVALAAEVVNDPRHLKRYFSPAGLLRFVVDLWSTTVKTTLVNGVRGELLERSLLVPDQKRSRAAIVLLWLGFLNFVLVGIVVAFFSGVSNFAQALLLVTCAAVNAVVVSAILSIRELLPLYDEVSLVLSAVRRPGWRLILLRAVLKALQVAASTLVFFVSLALLFVETGICHSLVAIHPWGDSFLRSFISILFLSVNVFLLLNLCWRSWVVGNTDQLTARAEALVGQYRRQLRHESPIKTLSAALSSPDYDEKLSLLVALYGIETIWLLA